MILVSYFALKLSRFEKEEGGGINLETTFFTPILELVKVIRSKNSGPFMLTLDLLMKDSQSYWLVKKSGVINTKLICDLYGVSSEEILELESYDAALAYKITLVRPIPSGNIHDTDIYGAQQYAPLLNIRIPVNDGGQNRLKVKLKKR